MFFFSFLSLMALERRIHPFFSCCRFYCNWRWRTVILTDFQKGSNGSSVNHSWSSARPSPKGPEVEKPQYCNTPSISCVLLLLPCYNKASVKIRLLIIANYSFLQMVFLGYKQYFFLTITDSHFGDLKLSTISPVVRQRWHRSRIDHKI